MLKNLLYIFQGSSYERMTFLRYAYTHLNWWSLQKRRTVTWTVKVKLLYCVTVFINILVLTLLFFSLTISFFLLSAVFLFFILPLTICSIEIAITPLDTLIKNHIINKARTILQEEHVTKIGITGSYGKTSAKEILYTVLKDHTKVVKTPGNINTDIGIAQFVIKNREKIKSADIFVVEMGADHRGDIAKLCDLIDPDYSILTGINEAHLEKFGSIENTITEKFTLPQRTKKMCFLNGDDKNVKENYKKYKLKNFALLSKKDASNIKILEPFGGFQFDFDGHTFTTQLLAQHNIIPLIAAIKAGVRHDISMSDIQKSIAAITPFPHRLNPIYDKDGDFWIIDDSYNANMGGVKSGINVLQRSPGRRVILTPGPLVEAGTNTEKLHTEIGALYAKNTDLVLLIQSSTTQFVTNGLKSCNFTNYKIYKTPQDAYTTYINVLHSGDTILLQNDFPDLYL